MKYNERIRALREDHDLKQYQIAELLHIGQKTYSDYELDNSFQDQSWLLNTKGLLVR